MDCYFYFFLTLNYLLDKDLNASQPSEHRANDYACVVVCVVIPFILDVMFVDVSAGVTQGRGHTGFLHLPSAVLALFFLARKIQPFLSLVDREVEFCVLAI